MNGTHICDLLKYVSNETAEKFRNKENVTQPK